MVCMIRSENTLTHAFKSFSERIIHTTIVYTIENPSVLTGVAVEDWDGQSLPERSIHVLKSIKPLGK